MLHLQNINTIVHVNEPLMFHWYHQLVIYHVEQYVSRMFVWRSYRKVIHLTL